MFHNKVSFYGEELTAPRPTPSWRIPLVGRPRLLIQYIRSYPPYWRLFLHPQSEDMPCHSDGDPLIMVTFFTVCELFSGAPVFKCGLH